MSQHTLDIEGVVREVLAELGLAPNGDAAAPEQANVVSSRSNDEPDESRELVLTGRVVTLGEIEGRLDGVCRMTVPTRSVVTPAVRDELRQRDILLTFASASGETVATGNDTKLVVVAVGTSFDPESLSEMLGSEGVEVTTEQCNCLIRATDQLGHGLAQPDTLGMLVTKHTAAGLCLANRHPGVRAVLGLDAATTASGIAAVGANLLVVDPGNTGPFQLKQLASQFCRGGPAVCPEVFADRLA
jgi:hypothetical protein